MTENLGEVILSHHGVKGMKWHKGGKGKKKVGPPPPPPIKLNIPNASAQQLKNAKAHAAADHNVAATKTNAALANIHQSFMQRLKSENASSHSATKQLAYQTAKQKHLDNLNKAAHDRNPAKDKPATPPKKYGIKDQKGGGWGVHRLHPVKHDDLTQSEPDILFTVTPVYESGMPKSVPTITDAELQHEEFSLVDAVLEHHGVKGMKWGVRKNRGGVSTPAQGVAKTKKGGVEHPEAKDHNQNHAVATKHGTGVLSDRELKRLVERMNMEQQFSRLNETNSNKTKIREGHKKVKELVDAGNTVNNAITFAKSPAGKLLRKTLVGV